MSLKSPLVVSASPLSEDVESIKKMEDSGASAVVLYSVFEEQLIRDQEDIEAHETTGADSFAEALSYFPKPDEYRLSPEQYLNHIRKAKEAVNMPVIASINGSSVGGWTDFAKQMEEAGADAVELNIYNIPADFDQSSADIEAAYVEILKSVKGAVKIPVALKLSPFFTNMANMAKQFDAAGADSLVLFNRFYQPGIDLENLEVVPNILLSHSAAMRIPMRWIAILYGKIKADLAATSGIHTGEDVIRMMMVGAKVTYLCSTLLKSGIGHIKTIEEQMTRWMEEREYASIEQMQGSMSQKKIKEPGLYERAQYMKALASYKIAEV